MWTKYYIILGNFHKGNRRKPPTEQQLQLLIKKTQRFNFNENDILAWLSDAPNDTFEEEPLIKTESIKKETTSIYDFDDDDNKKSPLKPFKSIKQEDIDNDYDDIHNDYDEIPDLDGSCDSRDSINHDDEDDPNRLYCFCKKVGINCQQFINWP